MDRRIARPNRLLALLVLAAAPALAQEQTPHRAPEPPQPPAQPATPQPPATLGAIVERHNVPALAVLGVAWDAESGAPATVLADQAGVRAFGSESPVGPDDLWHIGSCTKAFTATLLATFVAEGMLSWNDTLAAALPEHAELMGPTLRARTVADLLRHRAGMPANASPRLFGQLRSMDAAAGRAEILREALLTAVAVHESDAPLYSNTGYVIAGAIAQRLGGRPWEELLAQRVLAPLGIGPEQFGFGPPPAGQDVAHPLQPMGHAPVGRRWMPIAPGPMADNPPAYGPASTLHMTLSAWSRFAMAHARGHHLAEGQRDALGLSRADYAEMHRPEQGFAAGWLAAPRPWARGESGPGQTLSHAGSNTAWFAAAWIAPEKGWVLLAACNAAGQGGPIATDEAVGLALRALSEAGR